MPGAVGLGIADRGKRTASNLLPKSRKRQIMRKLLLYGAVSPLSKRDRSIVDGFAKGYASGWRTQVQNNSFDTPTAEKLSKYPRTNH